MTRWLVILAVFGTLATACARYAGPTRDEELARVRERAKFDLRCEQLELLVIDSYEQTGIPRTVGARGCESQATYLCVAGNSGCTWTMDTASTSGAASP